MAEAWTRHLLGNFFEAYSAGTQPRDIEPRAIKAMAEVGIDISAQKSKDINSLENMEFDYVVTFATMQRRPVLSSLRRPGCCTGVSMIHRNLQRAHMMRKKLWAITIGCEMKSGRLWRSSPKL